MPYLSQLLGFSSPKAVACSELSVQRLEDTFHALAGPDSGACTDHDSAAAGGAPPSASGFGWFFATWMAAPPPCGLKIASTTSSRLKRRTLLSRSSSPDLSR